MSEVRMPELAKTMADLGAFAQVGSDATRRLCEQGQCVTNALSAWQSESKPVSHAPYGSEQRSNGARGEGRPTTT